MTSGSKMIKLSHLYDQFYKLSTTISTICKKDKYAIAFSSCNPGDGASTVSVNMAYGLVKDSSKTVLLIDGNLRNPVLHKEFEISREKGLVDIVKGEIGFKEALTKIVERQFYFIPAGSPIENPIILFESEQFLKTVEKLRGIFDFIIFDSSAILRSPEATVLASRLDGVIMVLQAETTRWQVAQVAKESLESANVRIFGAILNKKNFYIPQKIYQLL